MLPPCRRGAEGRDGAFCGILGNIAGYLPWLKGKNAPVCGVNPTFFAKGAAVAGGNGPLPGRLLLIIMKKGPREGDEGQFVTNIKIL